MSTAIFLVEEKEEEKQEEEWKPFIPATPSAILYAYYSVEEPGKLLTYFGVQKGALLGSIMIGQSFLIGEGSLTWV